MKTMILWAVTAMGMIASIACLFVGMSFQSSLDSSFERQREFRSLANKVQRQLNQGIAVANPDRFGSQAKDVLSALQNLIAVDQFYRDLAFAFGGISFVASSVSAWCLSRRFRRSRPSLEHGLNNDVDN